MDAAANTISSTGSFASSATAQPTASSRASSAHRMDLRAFCMILPLLFFSLPENGGITNKPPSRLRAAAVSFPKGRLRRFQRQPYAERGRAFMKKARAPKKARGQKRLMQTSPLVHVSFSNAEGRAVSSLTLNRMLRRGPGSIAFATGTGARRQFHYVISGGFLSSNMQKMRI